MLRVSLNFFDHRTNMLDRIIEILYSIDLHQTELPCSRKSRALCPIGQCARRCARARAIKCPYVYVEARGVRSSDSSCLFHISSVFSPIARRRERKRELVLSLSLFASFHRGPSFSLVRSQRNDLVLAVVVIVIVVVAVRWQQGRRLGGLARKMPGSGELVAVREVFAAVEARG